MKMFYFSYLWFLRTRNHLRKAFVSEFVRNESFCSVIFNQFIIWKWLQSSSIVLQWFILRNCSLKLFRKLKLFFQEHDFWISFVRLIHFGIISISFLNDSHKKRFCFRFFNRLLCTKISKIGPHKTTYEQKNSSFWTFSNDFENC